MSPTIAQDLNPGGDTVKAWRMQARYMIHESFLSSRSPSPSWYCVGTECKPAQ